MYLYRRFAGKSQARNYETYRKESNTPGKKANFFAHWYQKDALAYILIINLNTFPLPTTAMLPQS
jgi:hypothetical protein